MPMARPTMAASASGVLKARSRAELASAGRAVTLKTPPLPFTSARFCSRLQSATSSPKTTMSRIAAHLLAQGGVDADRPWSWARRWKCGLGVRTRRRWGRRIGIEVPQGGVAGRAGRRAEPARVASLHLVVDFVGDAAGACWRSSDAFVDQKLAGSGRAGSRSASACALGGGLVEALVVGERMRVGADARGRGPAPGRCRRGSSDGGLAWRGRRRGNRCRPLPGGRGRGSRRRSAEMLPPAVCASTGTEMA